MIFLLRTLSLSYARRHLAKTLLTLLGVVVGVATFSSIRSAQGTLVAGIRTTVDRAAGKAQLQITMEGGVPEETMERVRNLPGIRATSPVIEQIVTPVRGELGSLLVIGVDLLGDREMRDYGFAGEDADLDDPLLFLAQPDSAIFTRPFAERAGLKTGDALALRLPTGIKEVAARGLLTPKGFAEAFGGNLLVVDVYAAQELFGRGRRFDRLDVRLAEGAGVAEGIKVLTGELGPAYRVETPARRGEQMERIVANFVAGFNASSVFALAIGIFLIFNAFNVAVNRRRRDIGTLRALGATPRQVQALFLAEALVLGVAGGGIGCLAGSSLAQGFLQLMRETTETVYGVSGSGLVRMEPEIILHSLLLGMVASLVGAWGPALTAARIPPAEAFAKGSFQARPPGRLAPRLALGVAALAGAILLARHPPFGGNLFLFTVLFTGGSGLVLLAGPLSRLLLRGVLPPLAWVAPVAGRLAADALLGNPRRTAGTVMAMTLSLTFVLGLGGYMGSTKVTMMRWLDEALTCDLFVRASANFSRPDFLFPGSLREELLRLPGVKAVESYRGVRPLYRGEQILLSSIEIGPLLDRARYEFLQGDGEAMRQGLTWEDKCTVSENFFRRFGVGAGQEVELVTPSGVVRLPVVAVVRDYSSDLGTVLIDRAYFLRLWGDERVDIFDVSLAAGADVGQARDLIRAGLAGRYPALVSTRQEFTAEIGRAIDGFYALMRITVLLALVVAFLGIVSSLLISVAERTREIGILKALGAVPGQIARSIVAEAVLLGWVGLLMAIPAGDLFASFMEGAIAESYTGWRMPHYYPGDILAQLLLCLPLVSAWAAWIPARQAGRMKITEAIVYE